MKRSFKGYRPISGLGADVRSGSGQGAVLGNMSPPSQPLVRAGQTRKARKVTEGVDRGGAFNPPDGIELITNEFSTAFSNAEYVQIPHDAAQNNVTAFSAFIWLERGAAIGGTDTMFSKWAYQTDGGWAMGLLNADVDRLQLFIATSPNDNGNGCQLNSINDDLVAGWNHVGFTFAPNDVRVYVNGVEEPVSVTGTEPAVMQASTADLLIGTFGGSLISRLWVGFLDEFTIWGKTLSAVEVAELYNLGTPFDPRSHSAAADLLGYWPLGDAPGDYATSNEIVDLSGNDFNGTLINGSVSNRGTNIP